MIEIILIAKIWFWIRVLAIIISPMMLRKSGYEQVSNRSYGSHINHWLWKIVEGITWTILLWWLIWGQR